MEGPGECRANVPRSWWQGDDERLHARLGFRSARRCGARGSKLSWTASLSTVVFNSQLTPHWCVLSTETAHQWVALHNRTASCFSPHTTELLGRRARSKLVVLAVGLKRRGCSCLCWPEPRFVARIHIQQGWCLRLRSLVFNVGAPWTTWRRW